MAQSRLFYLLDASAVVDYHRSHEKVTPQLEHIIEQHGLKRAFIYIPQFCIAEVFNTFAKFHYRKKETYPLEYQERYLQNYKSLSEEDYKKICENFREAIRFGKIFYNYELNRYHTFNADHVMKFEHQIELTRRNPQTQKEEPWFLSTFDILIIAMGMELARINGEGRTYILTCDERIKIICEHLKTILEEKEIRVEYKIPDYIHIPKAFYLYKTSVADFPRVSGQTI